MTEKFEIVLKDHLRVDKWKIDTFHEFRDEHQKKRRSKL